MNNNLLLLTKLVTQTDRLVNLKLLPFEAAMYITDVVLTT